MIVARSHTKSSGEMTKEEHARFIAFTADSMRDLYERHPHANYVVAFQNWLKPAGASFDHLDKQIVAIDDRGRALRNLEALVLENPNIFQDKGLDVARRHNLIIEENEHAVLLQASDTGIRPWRSIRCIQGARGSTAKSKFVDSVMFCIPRT